MEYIVPLDAKVAVLCGGMSSEREVSLRSGNLRSNNPLSASKPL